MNVSGMSLPHRMVDDLIVGMRKSVRPGVMKLRNFVQGRPAARSAIAEVKSVENLIADGMHPLHADYVRAQTYLSVFGELASRLKEFGDFARIVGNAEETYVPGWPPMSPVSLSFFCLWALLDVPVGPSGETMCECAAVIGRAFGMSEDFAATLDTMGRSAMGIYEHLGWHGGLLRLRDILDSQEYQCIVPSGYLGAKGELWYTRLLPSRNDAFAHGVAFTSPYVLIDTTKKDWFAFFARNERRTSSSPGVYRDAASCGRALLKLGPNPNYWNEYVLLAYHNASNSAIELCGIPDRLQSLPHANLARA